MSAHTTSFPDFIKSLTRWPPIKPPAPQTKIFFSLS